MNSAKQYEYRRVSGEHNGLTVEGYLREILKISGRRIQKLTRHQGILLNGKTVFLQRKLKAGDVLAISILNDVSYGVHPEPGVLDILYEDAHLIVLNKQPNLLVHPTGRTFSGTLANFLAYYFQEKGEVITIRPLHRLDRDTSGCVVFAKDAQIQAALAAQLHSGQLKRTYQAVVEGKVEPSAGLINAPLAPNPTMANRRVVSAQGEPAITGYSTLANFAKATLLELSLETGRTHQIRVHLAHIGHPIIGDRMYGRRSPYISRQALHAVSLSLIHPVGRHPLKVRAPLPADLQQLIKFNRGLAE